MGAAYTRPGLAAALIAVLLSVAPGADATLQRSPTSITISTAGPTTITIRYADDNQALFTSPGAVFCRSIPLNQGACPASQSLGRLSPALDRSSTNVPTSSLTDTVTIPYSIVRRVLKQAEAGNTGALVYIRQFDPVGGANLGNGAGVTVFSTVTLRLGPGGALAPLSLTRVELYGTEPGLGKVRLIRVNPDNAGSGVVRADIRYTGTGVLRGWWEVRRPGDPPIREIDRFAEGSLSQEERTAQRRFRRVKRFRVQLPATGRATLTGPRYADLPQDQRGRYEILLRIDATKDLAQQSALAVPNQNRNLYSGGATGFPLQTLEYWVTAGVGRRGVTALNARLVVDDAAGGIPATSVVWTPVVGMPAVRISVIGPDGRSLFRMLAPMAKGVASLPPRYAALVRSTGHRLVIAPLEADRRPAGAPRPVRTAPVADESPG